MAQLLLVINNTVATELICKKVSRRQQAAVWKEDGRESVLAVLIFHLSGPDSAKHLTTCLILGA